MVDDFKIYFNKLIKNAENNLNDSLRHFETAPTALVQEFVDLKLQSCIFQYDICAEMVGILRNKSEGFASSVALKGLVLRLFEYDQILNRRLIPRLLKLAKARGIEINELAIKDLRKKWKSEFIVLKSWHEVRNQAAGHYGQDIIKQVELLKSLTLDGVMTVAHAFLSFNMGLLVLLGDTGRGVINDSELTLLGDE